MIRVRCTGGIKMAEGVWKACSRTALPFVDMESKKAISGQADELRCYQYAIRLLGKPNPSSDSIA